MADELSDRFNAFIRKITLSDSERNAALKQGLLLSQKLEQRPEIQKSLITGSMARKTAIRKYSDVDLVVVIEKNDPLSQAGSADLVRALSGILREMELQVQVSENAARVRTVDGVTVDVLAAIQTGISNASEDEYRISSSNRNGWERYAPEEQNRRIRESAAILGDNFKKLIRLIKWWSKINGHPISSYAIESAACQAFRMRMPEMAQAVIDMYEYMGSSTCLTLPEMSIFIEAKGVAEEAYSCWQSGNKKESVQLWGRLFGEQF